MTEKQFDKQVDRLADMVEKLDPATVGKAFIAFIAEDFRDAMGMIDFDELEKDDDVIDFIEDGFQAYAPSVGSLVSQLLQDADNAGQK